MKTIIAMSILLSAILTPNIGLFRAEYLIVLVGILVGMATGKWKYIKNFKKELKIISFMFFSSAMGLFSQVLHGHGFIWRDAMIFVQIGFTLGIIIFVAMYSSDIKRTDTLTRVIIFIGAFSAIITILQYFNLFHINERLFAFTATRYEWLLEGVSWRRAVGTFGNPNYWGFLLGMLVIYSTYAVFWKNKLLHLPLIGLLVYAMILTGSRGALISYVAGVVLGGSILFLYQRVSPKPIAIIFAVVVIITSLSMVVTSKLFDNEKRYSVSNIDTLNARMDIWALAWNESLSSPVTILFGQGPRKGENVVHFGDNGYIRSWRDYGVLGLFLYLFLLITMYRRTLQLLRQNKGDQDQETWICAMLLIIIAWCVFEMSADSWYFSRASAVFLTIYVLVHSIYQNQLTTDVEEDSKDDSDHGSKSSKSVKLKSSL